MFTSAYMVPASLMLPGSVLAPVEGIWVASPLLGMVLLSVCLAVLIASALTFLPTAARLGLVPRIGGGERPESTRRLAPIAP